jgi:hypothetical protein
MVLNCYEKISEAKTTELYGLRFDHSTVDPTTADHVGLMPLDLEKYTEGDESAEITPEEFEVIATIEVSRD